MKYQISIIDSDADMDKVREICVDLLHDDQANDSPNADGSTAGSNSIYIDSDKATVGEAVRRINDLGYATDEDEDE